MSLGVVTATATLEYQQEIYYCLRLGGTDSEYVSRALPVLVSGCHWRWQCVALAPPPARGTPVTATDSALQWHSESAAKQLRIELASLSARSWWALGWQKTSSRTPKTQ